MFSYGFLISRSLKNRNAPASSMCLFSALFTKPSPTVPDNVQPRLAQNRGKSMVGNYNRFTRKMMKGSYWSHYYLQCMSLSYSYASFSSHQKNHRKNHRKDSQWKSANRSTVMYMVSLAIAVMGLSYAAVPLYRLFCQASGYGGTVARVQASEKIEKMEPIRERELTIR